MLNLYVLYDTQLKISNPPFVARNRQDAERALRDSLAALPRDRRNVILDNTVLMCVGSFDELKPSISACDVVTECLLSDFKIYFEKLDSSKGDSGGAE